MDVAAGGAAGERLVPAAAGPVPGPGPAATQRWAAVA